VNIGVSDNRAALQFDYARSTQYGEPSWPERHGDMRFGPSLIEKAWRAGLVVCASVATFPRPIVATQVRWGASGVLEVKCPEGWLVPDRLWTRTTMKGVDSSGFLQDDAT